MHAAHLPAHGAPPLPLLGQGALPPAGLLGLGVPHHPLSVLAKPPEIHRPDDKGNGKITTHFIKTYIIDLNEQAVTKYYNDKKNTKECKRYLLIMLIVISFTVILHKPIYKNF